MSTITNMEVQISVFISLSFMMKWMSDQCYLAFHSDLSQLTRVTKTLVFDY